MTEVEKLSAIDDERLCCAIGDIVINFQHMELWLSELLAKLLEVTGDDGRYKIMASMSFRQKVDLMYVLFQDKAENHFGADVELGKKGLYKAEEFRNRVVHSVWSVAGHDTSWVREKSSLRGKGYSRSEKFVNIKMLEEAAKSIKTLKEWEFRSNAVLQAAINQLEKCESST
ncbi:MAG: hypothetical protein ACQEW0_00750 [Pseudomonadota bacterium]